MQLVAVLSGILVALLPFVALYRVVAREDRKIAATATAEMWDRTIDDYTQHLDTSRPTGCDGPMGRRESSLRDCAASAPNNTSAVRG